MSLGPRGKDPAPHTRVPSPTVPIDDVNDGFAAIGSDDAGDPPPVSDVEASTYPASQILLRPAIYRDPAATVEIPRALFSGPVTAASVLPGHSGGARQPELVRGVPAPRQVPTMPPRAPTTPAPAPQRPTTAPESPRPSRWPYWLPWPLNRDSEPPPKAPEPTPSPPESPALPPSSPDTNPAPSVVTPESPKRPEQEPRTASPPDAELDSQVRSLDPAANEEKIKQLIGYFGEAIRFYALQQDNRGTPFTVRGTNILIQECLSVAEKEYMDIFANLDHTAGGNQDGKLEGEYKKEDTLETDDGDRRPDMTLTHSKDGIDVSVYANTASTHVDGTLTSREKAAIDAMAKKYVIRSLRKLREGDSEDKYRADAQGVCRELLDEMRKKLEEEYERKKESEEKEREDGKKPGRTERDK